MGIRISELTDASTLTGAELLELSRPSATITITAATISALASDNSFNDSASGFVDAGFAVGDSVRVQGFTGDVANNLFSARVTVLTAGKMTIGGTDGDAIVDDAAGESVTITRWESRRTTLSNGATASSGLADLEFSRVQTVALAELLPTAGVIVNEPFASDSGQFTKYTEGTAATFAVTGGQATITNSSGAARNDIIATGADLDMPQIAVQIDVASRSGSGASYDNVSVGIVKDANNFVVAGIDRIAGNARMQIKIGGSSSFQSDVGQAWSASPPYKLGFSLIGQSACMWVDKGSGWEYVTGYTIPTGTINFKTASLTGWRAGCTVATGGNCAWTFDNLKSGRFGGFGWRDFTWVTEEDGSPYIAGGDTGYFLATCNDGLGASHQGVFSIDLSTYATAFVGSLMVSRSGATQNDLAGHVIRYSAASYRLTITSWGNGFGGALDLYSGMTTQDLLGGSYIVIGLSKLTLPTQPVGGAAYDGMLIKTGGVWQLAHTICTNTSFSGSPFYPALASSSDLSTWTQVFTDSAARPFEGTKWAKLGNDYYITASSPFQTRVYDQELNFRGHMKATFDGGTVTQPHAAVIDAGTKKIMLSFNQKKPPGINAAFSWGEMIVHET